MKKALLPALVIIMALLSACAVSCESPAPLVETHPIQPPATLPIVQSPIPTPNPTPTQVTPGLGESRANPFPVGSIIRWNNKEMKVLNVEKKSYSNYQDISIVLQWTNLGTPDQTEYASSYDFDLVGNKGKIYGQILFIGQTGEGAFPGGEYSGGATITGTIERIADVDDTGFILIWQAHSKELYLRLE